MSEVLWKTLDYFENGKKWKKGTALGDAQGRRCILGGIAAVVTQSLIPKQTEGAPKELKGTS